MPCTCVATCIFCFFQCVLSENPRSVRPARREVVSSEKPKRKSRIQLATRKDYRGVVMSIICCLRYSCIDRALRLVMVEFLQHNLPESVPDTAPHLHVFSMATATSGPRSVALVLHIFPENFKKMYFTSCPHFVFLFRDVDEAALGDALDKSLCSTSL